MLNKKFITILLSIFIAVHMNNMVYVKAESTSQSTVSSESNLIQNNEASKELIIKYKNNEPLIDSDANLNIDKVKVKNDDELKRAADFYKKKKNIELVQPNYIYKSSNINDPLISSQWGLQTIDFPSAWSETSPMGKGVKIAVLDTGIDIDHEDLAQNIIGGYNTIEENGSFNDDNGHGTHTAGIIAAQPNNGIGVAGVAGYSSILAVKVLDKDGYGTSESIARGILWAVDNDTDIINMSLGTGYEDPLIKSAIDFAYSKGILIIAAAGNDFGGSVSFPASYDKVIAVSALNESNGLADFSNYGKEIDLAAPGVNILSTLPNHTNSTGLKNYGIMSGTSMAAPFITGVAALIKSQNPDISVDALKSKLLSNTRDIGEKGLDILYGNGLISTSTPEVIASSDIYKKLTGDNLEDNNAYALAKTYNSSSIIKANIFPQNDIDWYKLIIPAGLKGIIDFTSPSSANNEIYVLDGVSDTSFIVYYGERTGKYSISPASYDRTFYIAVLDAFEDQTKDDYTINLNIGNPQPTIKLQPITTYYSHRLSSYVPIKFVSNEAGKYGIRIYDRYWRLVKDVPYGNSIRPGENIYKWDRKDAKSRIITSGTYYASIYGYDLKGNAIKPVTSTLIFDSTSPYTSLYTKSSSFKLNSSAQIRLKLSENSYVTAGIYDSKGHLILQLYSNKNLNSGYTYLYWNGKNSSNKFVSRGTYYLRVYTRDLAGNTYNSSLRLSVR